MIYSLNRKHFHPLNFCCPISTFTS